MKTKVFTNEKWKNNEMFRIFQVDDDGNKITEFCKKTGDKIIKKELMKFGVSKADLLIKHLSELKEFQINANMKEGN